MRYGKGFRRKNKDAIHDACVEALRAAGRQVVELDGAKDDEPGIPDVLVVWPGGMVLMEFKSYRDDYNDVRGGKLNEHQQKWHARYRGPAGTLLVIRSVAAALRATGVALAA